VATFWLSSEILASGIASSTVGARVCELAGMGTHHGNDVIVRWGRTPEQLLAGEPPPGEPPPPGTRPEPAPKSAPRLPWNPFARAHAGEWCVLTRRFKDAVPSERFCTWKVFRVEGDAVTVEKRFDGGAPGYRVFSTREEPTVAAFFDLPAERPVEELSSVEGQRELADRTFPGARVAFRGGGEETIAWFSSSVPAAGLVTLAKVLPHEAFEERLAGYGRSDKADWGKTPAELKAARDR
jgi:hypothetical protein